MKSERQQKILELIGEYEIETQEELIFYLDAKVMKHMGKTEQ